MKRAHVRFVAFARERQGSDVNGKMDKNRKGIFFRGPQLAWHAFHRRANKAMRTGRPVSPGIGNYRASDSHHATQCFRFCAVAANCGSLPCLLCCCVSLGQQQLTPYVSYVASTLQLLLRQSRSRSRGTYIHHSLKPKQKKT